MKLPFPRVAGKVALTGLCFWLFFSISCNNDFQDDSPLVAGSYVQCDMDCIRIDIRHDGTFSYLVQGDMINAADPVTGKWEMLEFPGLIRANSYQQPDRFPITRNKNLKRSDILVTVKDLAFKTALPGIGLELRCNDIAGERDCDQLPARAFTDNDGRARFANCASCRDMVLFAKLSGNAEAFWIIDTITENEIAVEIAPLISLFIRDELWLIFKGNLYFVGKFYLKGQKD